jgi:hypothetical protein
MLRHGRASEENSKQPKSSHQSSGRANRYIRGNRPGDALTAWGRVDPELAAATYESTVNAVAPDG